MLKKFQPVIGQVSNEIIRGFSPRGCARLARLVGLPVSSVVCHANWPIVFPIGPKSN